MAEEFIKITINDDKIKLVETNVIIVKKEEDTKISFNFGDIQIKFILSDETSEKQVEYKLSDDKKIGYYYIKNITHGGVGVWKPISIATIKGKQLYLTYLVNKVGVRDENTGYRFEYSLYSEV